MAVSLTLEPCATCPIGLWCIFPLRVLYLAHILDRTHSLGVKTTSFFRPLSPSPLLFHPLQTASTTAVSTAPAQAASSPERARLLHAAECAQRSEGSRCRCRIRAGEILNSKPAEGAREHEGVKDANIREGPWRCWMDVVAVLA